MASRTDAVKKQIGEDIMASVNLFRAFTVRFSFKKEQHVRQSDCHGCTGDVF